MIIKKNKKNTKEVLLGETQEVVSQNNAEQESTSVDTVLIDSQAANTDVRVEEPLEDLFDIENIDFTQRQERRRGSRRRGYRRIDDRNLVSRAQEEAENIKKAAFEEGYRLGLEKANSDIDKFKTELTHFMNAKKEVFEYIAPDILEISIDIAKKVIKKEVETDPQVLLNTIVDVLRSISKNEPKVSIRVRPQSVQFIKDTISNITYQYGIESKINIISDPAVDEGGCIFQTNNGIVDASIDTQVEIIKKALES